MYVDVETKKWSCLLQIEKCPLYLFKLVHISIWALTIRSYSNSTYSMKFDYLHFYMNIFWTQFADAYEHKCLVNEEICSCIPTKQN